MEAKAPGVSAPSARSADLDPRRFAVLLSIAEHGSFSAAADATSYTQSAVSQQVAALERQVGCELVDRGARPLRLTSAGEVLAQRYKTMSLQLDTALAEVRAIVRKQSERLSLCTSPGAMSALVVPALQQLLRRFPSLEVQLQEEEHGVEALELVQRGKAEVALICGCPECPPALGLRVHPLFEDPYDLLVPPRHRLLQSKEVPMQELVDEEIFVPRALQGERWSPGGLALAPAAQMRVVNVGNAHLALAMVQAERGLALIPRLDLRSLELDRVQCRPVAPAPTRRVLAVARREPVQSEAERTLLRLLKTAAAAHAPVASEPERRSGTAG